MRFVARLATLIGLLLVAFPAHGALRLVRLRSRWPQRFLRLAARACGARVRIIGAPLTRDVLFVANHISWLDILVLGGATGAAFVSKAEVQDWPVVGRLARIAGTIFVARERRSAARGQADALATALAGGRPAALFAEGSTGDGLTLKPFRASLLAAVGEVPGVRVQPVRIDYGAEAAAIAWPEEEGAGANAVRVLGMAARRRVTLMFLDPIDTAAQDRKAIAAQARAAIDAAAPRTYSAAA